MSCRCCRRPPGPQPGLVAWKREGESGCLSASVVVVAAALSMVVAAKTVARIKVKIFMVEVDRVVLRVANVALYVNVRSGK
jgi:hypothetical protein